MRRMLVNWKWERRACKSSASGGKACPKEILFLKVLLCFYRLIFPWWITMYADLKKKEKTMCHLESSFLHTYTNNVNLKYSSEPLKSQNLSNSFCLEKAMEYLNMSVVVGACCWHNFLPFNPVIAEFFHQAPTSLSPVSTTRMRSG